MGYRRSFLAGGSVRLVAIGAEQRIFVRQVNLPRHYVEAHAIGVGSQQLPAMMPVLLTFNGRTLLAGDLFVGVTNSEYALPFLLFDAQGTLECFITNTSGVQTTISCHVSGVYAPRA